MQVKSRGNIIDDVSLKHFIPYLHIVKNVNERVTQSAIMVRNLGDPGTEQIAIYCAGANR